MSTAKRRRDAWHSAAPRERHQSGSLASIYIDMAASRGAVHTAVAKLPLPQGVTNIRVDDRSITDTFGCRIAIDLTGTFKAAEGSAIARQYARQLSALIGVPAFALYDLLRTDSSKFLY
jgi:hypothetical protein